MSTHQRSHSVGVVSPDAKGAWRAYIVQTGMSRESAEKLLVACLKDDVDGVYGVVLHKSEEVMQLSKHDGTVWRWLRRDRPWRLFPKEALP